MVLVHELSWSVSRAGTFAACRRRYYLDYYLSWGGWSDDAPRERAQAYRLKKMTRLPMLAGDVLHQAIAEYFDRRSEGKAMTEEELFGMAVTGLRKGYKESRDGKGLWRDRPGKSVHLAEHHYREPCVDESGTAAAEYGRRFVERLQVGARHFMNAPALAELHQLGPADLVCVEGRAPGNRFHRGLPTIELNGSTVFAIPDFAHRRGEEVVIYDWKSGSPREQDEFQLAVYALFARQTWGSDPERVVCVDAYLTGGEEREVRHTAAQIEEAEERIRVSMAEMEAVHFDADASAGDPEAFPMVEEGSRECRQCSYRELCGRGV